MATLLNTLLASLFPALVGAHQATPPAKQPLPEAEITVRLESDIDCTHNIYFFQSV